MKTIPRKTTLRASRIPLLLSACAAASALVIAAEPPVDTEITVSAERPTSTVVGRTSSGGQIVLYEISYRLNYEDLDLATSAGADELRKRVQVAATSACKDLDKLHPLSKPDGSCVRKTAENSMPQADRAISLAQTKGVAKTK